MDVLAVSETTPRVVDGNGDSTSGFEAAFDVCSAALYRYIAVRTGDNGNLADDLMQQLWLQAYPHQAKIPPNELELYLRGIAKNLVRNHWRKRSRRPKHLPMSDPQLAAELAERLTGEPLPLAVLEQREVRDQLLLALTELPGEDQALIIRHYFDDLSHADLGAKMGISSRAVEGKLYRARQELKRMLQRLEV